MSEPKVSAEEYTKNVKWLREHVAPDDVYDFAQQAVMAAEFFIGRLHQHIDITEEVKTDPMLYHWITNIYSLSKMKVEGFKGIVNVNWREDK